MARASPSQPLVAVIGATGTGKSQLAVELATRFNGEIINGDAMQLYSGLPIITNKITTEEQHGIPHHLLGCIGLKEQTWVVGTFVQQALRVIGEIRSRGKLPILVGGTHYYTQSLLFDDRLADAGNGEMGTDEAGGHDRQSFPLLEQPTEVLYEELKSVDPAMAERWHPNDRRKIQRSLEIYLKTGKKASETYAEQRSRQSDRNEVGKLDGGPGATTLRFPTLLLWVHAEQDALRARLDGRVDKMLKAGLLDEVLMLNSHADAEAAKGSPVDETRGIWVSIGYKEFKSYARALQGIETREKDLSMLKADALEKTKSATRQYAKRQIRWIRIKLANALNESNASDKLYVFDASDASSFHTSATEPAMVLVQGFLDGEPLPSSAHAAPAALAEVLKPKRDHDISSKPENWSKEHCEACNVTCVVHDQWLQHVNSKAHKKLVSKRRKQAQHSPTAAANVTRKGRGQPG